MIKHRSRIAGLALALSASAAFALPSGPSFRADDGELFRLEDNPAKMAFAGGPLRLGLAWAPSAASPSCAYDLAAAIPYLGYARLSEAGGTESYDLGTGLFLGRGRGLALGYDWAWDSRSTSTVGLLLRPASFASLGLTASYPDGAEAIYGVGIALRPLALGGGAGSALTLTADSAYSPSSGLSLESLGLRLALPGLVSLRGWYAFQSSGASLGLEASVALGPAALTGRASGAGIDSAAYRVSSAVSLGLPSAGGESPAAPSLGKKILVIGGLESVSALPVGAAGLPFSPRRSASFPELLARLEAARADRSVAAVAFENLPRLPGLSYYEELAAELAALRAAGKKVYFYADSYGREIAYLSTVADAMALNPSGAVELAGYSFRRLYWKPLFDSIGLSFVNLAPWDTKSAYNSLSEDRMPQGERDMMERFYGGLQKELGEKLAAGRGAKLKKPAADTIADGPFLSSAAALSAGLVDKVAYRDEFEDAVQADFPKASLVGSLETGAASSDLSGEAWGPDAFARRVAVVWLAGDIGEGRGVAGAEIGSLAADELKRLRTDPSVSAILLRVDSPGGSAFMSDLIAREVRLAVAAGKPVAVSMGAYATSGGYYISAPASRIFAEPGTVTGSIGVTGLLPNLSGSLAKLGLKYDGFELSPGSSLADPLKPADEAEQRRLKDSVLFVYDRFVETVAAGRKMDKEKVRAIGEGRIWTGREALDRGLVDELGGLSEAKAYLSRKLGGRVAFDDYLPGDAPSLLESLLPLASSASSLEKALSPLAAPIGARLGRLLSLGEGPLYYLDVESLGL